MHLSVTTSSEVPIQIWKPEINTHSLYSPNSIRRLLNIFANCSNSSKSIFSSGCWNKKSCNKYSYNYGVTSYKQPRGYTFCPVFELRFCSQEVHVSYPKHIIITEQNVLFFSSYKLKLLNNHLALVRCGSVRSSVWSPFDFFLKAITCITHLSQDL